MEEALTIKIAVVEESFSHLKQKELTLPGLIGPDEPHPTLASFASFMAKEGLPEMEKRVTAAIQNTRLEIEEQLARIESTIRSNVGADLPSHPRTTQQTEYFESFKSDIQAEIEKILNEQNNLKKEISQKLQSDTSVVATQKHITTPKN